MIYMNINKKFKELTDDVLVVCSEKDIEEIKKIILFLTNNKDEWNRYRLI